MDISLLLKFIKSCLTFIFLSATCWRGCYGLKGVRISLPTAVSPGDTVTMECHYDLEGDPLYTIKWYKGRDEFYRYLPKEHPETRVFPQIGINVDISASKNGKLVLRDVTTELAGKYRCEVSADAPNFHTVVVSAILQVVEKLVDNPELILEKATYTAGGILRGNCTSPPHLPPANLTVYVNGNKVKTSVLESTKDEFERISTTVSILLPELPTRGRIRIHCVADIYNVFKTQTELILEEDKPIIASVLGNRDSGSDGTIRGTKKACLLVSLLSIGFIYKWR